MYSTRVATREVVCVEPSRSPSFLCCCKSRWRSCRSGGRMEPEWPLRHLSNEHVKIWIRVADFLTAAVAWANLLPRTAFRKSHDQFLVLITTLEYPQASRGCWHQRTDGTLWSSTSSTLVVAAHLESKIACKSILYKSAWQNRFDSIR